MTNDHQSGEICITPAWGAQIQNYLEFGWNNYFHWFRKDEQAPCRYETFTIICFYILAVPLYTGLKIYGKNYLYQALSWQVIIPEWLLYIFVYLYFLFKQKNIILTLGSLGNAILGAAIIDDILGIIVLTIVTSLGGGKATAGDSAPLWLVLLKIALFFVFVAIFGYIVYKFFKWWRQRDGKGMHRHAIMAFVICLLMSFAAEYFFGVADITGAFFAGVIISMTQEDQFIASKFDVIGYMFLSPIFFASIGLKVDGDAVMSMGWTVAVFAVLLTVIAVVTKIIGCGLGAKVCGYKNYQCIRIGVGMISRGEVALIVANKGIEAGLMSSAVVAPVIIVVIVTTIVTPIVLKPVFMSGNKTASDVPTTSKLVENYEQREKIGKTNR